ncbi:MAG: DNA translocase FtsK 4TM domain-containing protein [Nitrospirota bacterium]
MAERLKRIREEVTGIISILGGIYLGLSLYSYSKWDPSLFTFTRTTAKNYGGIAGAYISDFLITLTGLSSFSIPVFLIVYGIKRLLGKKPHRIYLFGAVLFVFSSSLMVSLLLNTFNINTENNPGGIAGLYISGFLEKYFSVLGAYLFSLTVFLTSVILLSPVSVTSLAIRREKTKASSKQKETVKGVLEEEILIREPEKVKTEPVLTETIPDFKTGKEPGPPEAARVPGKYFSKSGYELPSVELLTSYDTASIRPSKEELLANSALLESKLADFDVEGKITHVSPGPVVTLYEFEPAPGVKINRVVSLSDDLALALKAQSMRVFPISGKAAIGIEVPNKQRELVSLREIVSSDKFRKSHSKLTLALGKDISGNPVIADLTRMPHLLVAGATGAGKSVSINSMVMSILYKASPREVKMLMIDPKLLELSIYEDIPHLISQVITNPKSAAEALRKMVFEMERRYRLLAEKGARNIENFNKQATEEEQLPYIVIFIDELADLMFASANEVEDSIARLAQMARAAGIHLVIATQRPSVDVITGVIKANFPARISFQVFSKIDSRTILDSQGAEQLLGKGDMLLMLPGLRITRVHGALITEDEIKSVTDFIKSQGNPDYSIFEDIQLEEPSSEGITEEKDEMYDKAVEFADSVGEISISSLQRRFKIGYNRAAKIMEIMEEDGLVGHPKGAGKPRDFLRRRH